MVFSDPPVPKSRRQEMCAAHLCTPAEQALPQTHHGLGRELERAIQALRAQLLQPKMKITRVLGVERFHAGGTPGRASPRVNAPSMQGLPLFLTGQCLMTAGETKAISGTHLDVSCGNISVSVKC